MIYPLHRNFLHCCLLTTQPSSSHMTTLTFLRLLPTQNFKKSANFFAQINWCCIQTKLNLLFFHAPILIRMFRSSATITTMAKISLKIFIQFLVYNPMTIPLLLNFWVYILILILTLNSTSPSSAKNFQKHFYSLRTVKNTLIQRSLLLLYNSVFHCHLLYAIHIWSCTNSSFVNDLFKLQKSAI